MLGDIENARPVYPAFNETINALNVTRQLNWNKPSIKYLLDHVFDIVRFGDFCRFIVFNNRLKKMEGTHSVDNSKTRFSCGLLQTMLRQDSCIRDIMMTV